MKVYVVFPEGNSGPRTDAADCYANEHDAIKEVDRRFKLDDNNGAEPTQTVEIDGVKYVKEWWTNSDFHTYYETYDVLEGPFEAVEIVE